MFKVAIVTVNFNGKKDTLELLESLEKIQDTRYKIQTIVVDNGSKDGSVSTINKRFPDVNILQNGANEGFSGGFNRGMVYAKIWGADYILIINNDALIKDGNLLQSMVDLFASDEKIGVISPKIHFAPGFEFYKDKYKKEDLGKVIWYGGAKFDWKNIHSVHKGLDEVDKGQFNKVGEVDSITGCCMMVKRQVLEKVQDFFDDDLFLYFEDIDFQKRVKKAGFKTYYDGRVTIYHKASQSSGIGSEITDFFHTRNRLIIGFRYGSLRTKLALIREALKFLILGREAQKKGVWDFFVGKRGASARFIKEVRQEQYQTKLSICVVNYNTADLTRNLLESIFNPKSGFDSKTMEVVVLDNGSEDGCSEVIKDFLPKIKYLQNKNNEGFSKGYNKTVSYSKGQYILLLNSDIEVMKDSLSRIIKWADHFQGQAVLGGRLIFPDRSPQGSVYNLPTIWGAVKEYFLAKKGSYFMYMPSGVNPTKVEGLVMACFLIPERVLNKVGLLDEGTFIFFEDIEYSRRLKKYGVPLYFIPSAKFIHHHGASTKKIGLEKANELLIKSSKYYHGAFYYNLLTFVLRLGQLFGRVQTPVSRWTK